MNELFIIWFIKKIQSNFDHVFRGYYPIEIFQGTILYNK